MASGDSVAYAGQRDIRWNFPQCCRSPFRSYRHARAAAVPAPEAAFRVHQWAPGIIRVMNAEPAEMSVRELRADLADVIHAASTRDHVTFLTSRGRPASRLGSLAPP